MGAGGFGISPDDMENGATRHVDFEEDSARRSFIKKVYMVLAAQLVVTLGLVAIMVTSDEFYDYVEENPATFLVALAVVFISMIVLVCSSSVRRTAPLNFICLGIFTLAESFLLGVIGSKYDPMVVLMAVGLTAAITVVLSLYAMQTKIDFTVMGGFLLICLIVAIIFSIFMLFFHSRMLMMIYASLGVILFSLFIIYDTQLMVSGAYIYLIGPEEYIFAALNLYIDIIQLFLCLLRLMGNNN